MLPAPTLFRSERSTSRGVVLSDPAALAPLGAALERHASGSWTAAPLIDGTPQDGDAVAITDPADRRRTVGTVRQASPTLVVRTLAQSDTAQAEWDATPAHTPTPTHETDPTTSRCTARSHVKSPTGHL